MVSQGMKHYFSANGRMVSVAGVLLGTILFLARRPILMAIGDFLVIQDELHPAQVIHVIGGPDDRTDYAIQLYKQGYGERIFFTGGWCTFHNYYHGRHGRERALEQGVPPEAIAIDDSQVTSTYAEVLLLKEFIARTNDIRPVRSVIVVSAPYHMRRARWTGRRVLGRQMDIQMAPVPRINSVRLGLPPYQRDWWTDPTSRQHVKREYLKIAYYYARYQFARGPVRKWLASFDRF
jgi:uncharacterized SAM-binding protein YcdF (DUF218 family)